MDKTNHIQTGLSVIIPHYNRPWCLEIAIATLQRALSKCDFQFEIIVADDGSTEKLDKFLKNLPVDQIYRAEPRDIDHGESTSIYRTISEAYKLARYTYLLHVEDDFWFVPQGFSDQGKNHISGLLALGDYTTEKNSIKGAIELLQSRQDIHFVELARGYSNTRYRSIPESEHIYEGIPFRTKRHLEGDIWYICAWPHIGRTEEILTISLPLDAPLWKGELEMMQQRRQFFGNGNWVCNPELCYFAHVNIFSWRQMHKSDKSKSANKLMTWTDSDDSTELPYKFFEIENFNSVLLKAFVEGKVGNKSENYFTSSPMAYIHDYLYKEVCI
jgi:glycosyltransferase involved in cell wall biosynthesis